MLKDKKIIFILSFLAIVIIVSVLFLLNKTNNNQRISAKLITSVHKDLPLEFKTDKNLIILKPGEVKTINYYVRNLSERGVGGEKDSAVNLLKQISKQNDHVIVTSWTLPQYERGKYLNDFM